MNLLLSEIKKFSKQNWWVYMLFIIALWLVAYTGRWNLIEIVILFLLNFLWNIFIMAMQSSFTNKDPKTWTLFQVIWTITFIILWIYWLYYLWQSQYIIWQIAYTLSAIKTFLHFNYNKNINFINWYLLVFLNIIFSIIFYKYFASWNVFLLIQAIWFWFSSTWFVVLKDRPRYFTILIWTWLIILWSVMLTYNSFLNWNLDWIALWYFILTWTVWIYYLKLLKKYL